MLKEILNRIVDFDSESLDAFLDSFTRVVLIKGKAFAKKGEYARNIAFVSSGVLRV